MGFIAALLGSIIMAISLITTLIVSELLWNSGFPKELIVGFVVFVIIGDILLLRGFSQTR